MRLEGVTQAFAQLAGLSEEGAIREESFCLAGIDRVTALLRPGVDPADQADRLERAAAGVALYLYRLQQVGERGSVTQLGDLHLSSPEGELNAAAQLREELLRSVSDLLHLPPVWICPVEEKP